MVYRSIYITAAFGAGIILTLGFKDVYPDLERRFRRRLRSNRAPQSLQPDTTNRAIALSDQTTGTPNPEKDLEILEGIEGCIGNTPLFRIKSLSKITGCEILAKAEVLQGSFPAEEEGRLSPYSGDVIYEGTVGSTGISLAALCRARGYMAHICMPNDQAQEKSDLLLKLGAEVERVQPAPIIDQNQFVNKARSLAADHTADRSRAGRGFFADQFENEANWHAHFEGTGPEIYRQTGGYLDAFVAGAGTGGTISGVARFLKPKLPNLKIVLADPQGSGLYNRIKYGVMFDPKEKEGTRRRHQVDTIVEGIGINRVTKNFEAGRELVDDAIRVDDDQAIAMARWLVENDGIFAGSSSCVNCEPTHLIVESLLTGYAKASLLFDLQRSLDLVIGS
ncbi:MAG: hypothetical protein M1837_001088 [Sclerophora amabilis]|nr:MAG: hypothetical protein M1837_001088 [Sclerophora amabilis]